MSQTKFTRTPIGLGIGNIEAEEDAAHIWNRAVDAGQEPTAWIENPVLARNAHCIDPQSCISLVGGGWAETDETKTRVRLTEKAAVLCKAYLLK